MNNIELIRSKIYEIRGQKVMLDRDLAELYEVTTSNLNKAVKRNIKRFPDDFMFQLNSEEFDDLKSNLIFQNGTSSWGGTRKLPYAFTEQGLAMLSGLLNSDIAIQVFTDYNDINEDTRLQLEAINIVLADLQTTHRKTLPRNRIGFKTDIK